MKVQECRTDSENTIEQNVVWGYKFKCPGCGHIHIVTTSNFGQAWDFNGNIDNPTFTPSLLVKSGYYVSPEYYSKDHEYSYLCHSFITDGKIQFLDDCTHKLKGQTVELEEIND